MFNGSGVYISQSQSRFDPFGNFRTKPPESVNPDRTNHGYTGHCHNNTGTNNLGLLYMNARYYLPEVGRFISPDTIVPDPQNPQSYNRFSYVLNSPVNYTDPTGHMECGIICEGDSVSEQELKFGLAYGGEWDPDQQAANAAKAESILTGVAQTVVGMLWEPADWGMALSDGFRWYDAIGFLPFVPATVGQHADDFAPLARALVDRVQFMHSQLDEIAQSRRTTAIVLAKDSDGGFVHLIASSEEWLAPVQRANLQGNDIPVDGPRKMHAEIKAIFAAEERGLNPLMVAASRLICERCSSQLADYGVVPVTPLKGR